MTRVLDRRSVVRGAAGLMGGALLAACGAEPVRRTAPSPLPLANVEPWGANVFLDEEDEAWKRRHSLELLRDAGVRWVFQRIGWDAVESVGQGLFVNPQRRESSWDRFDEIVDRAVEQDISVVARIERSPQWARPGRDNPTARR
jgi:arabinogalactan endo-1,4-beta-galactosidase